MNERKSSISIPGQVCGQLHAIVISRIDLTQSSLRALLRVGWVLAGFENKIQTSS